MTNWSESEYQELIAKQNKAKADKQFKKDKPSKMKNKKTTFYGIEFASIKEGSRYLELLYQEKKGEISNLKRQQQFILQEGFRDNSGEWHRAITYSADFQYKKDGKVITEDVKASKKYKTDIYRIKKKLLIYKYRDINFLETY